MVERLYPYRKSIIVGLNVVLLACSYLLAFLIRFEFRLGAWEWERMLGTLPFVVAIRLAVFGWYRLYEGMWRYVSVQDVVAIVKASSVSALIVAAGVLAFFREGFPRSVILLDWLLCIMLAAGVRLAVRVCRESHRNHREEGRRVLIVGAGDAGEMLFREIERNRALDYHVLGFVDDDPRKLGARIRGVDVVGTVGQLPQLCAAAGIQEVLIAIPSATGEQMRRILRACHDARVEFKTLPAVGEMMENGGVLQNVRRVKIEDLLRREAIRIERDGVDRRIRGKRVLVTGAGGSIGSELCRQLAAFQPSTLVLLDHAENGLFFVEMELRERFPKVPCLPVLGDVADSVRMEEVLRARRPQIVFHAAAHKHVPLMEANAGEAIRNNVLGTLNVANAAWRAAVEDFVMVSTDKAVRPTSVMGATKRLAEMYVQSLNAKIETRFMTVRFGNVLGSEGSVLQVFQRQIEAGGPITVTHPQMRRYFMTIPEACQLILQAAAQGDGGEIFLLNMGEPVRILDLATDLLALVGLEPGKDIEIVFTGVRPGEKLFEELLNPETRVVPTKHERIMVVETTPPDYDRLAAGIRELLAARESGRAASLVSMLVALVPEYRPDGGAPLSLPEARPRVLLADDDPYTRSTLKRILENRYNVFEATARRQLLEEIAARLPDVVILDHDLPGFGLRRLCAKIKTVNGHPAPGIILLTESAEVVSIERARALGADHRLYKPLQVDIVETRVKEAIETRG